MVISRWKMLNCPKKLNVVIQKNLLQFFPWSTLCPICFYLVKSTHVWMQQKKRDHKITHPHECGKHQPYSIDLK
jgi:hypothetical protein